MGDGNVRLFMIRAWIGFCRVICLLFCGVVVRIFEVIVRLVFCGFSSRFSVGFWTFDGDNNENVVNIKVYFIIFY